MKLILAASLAACFGGLYWFRKPGYVLQSAQMLGALGYEVGEAQVRGCRVAEHLLKWYSHDVGPSLLAYAQLGDGRRPYIVDCTKVEVPLDSGH